MGLFSDFFRGFCESEDRGSTSTGGGLLIVPVTITPIVTSVPTARPVNSLDWLKLFGHIKPRGYLSGADNENFNESRFPLEPEDQLCDVIGHEFLDMDKRKNDQVFWAHNHGMSLALPRATGLCLMANPCLVTEQRRVIGGGLWHRDPPNNYSSGVPVFFYTRGQLCVSVESFMHEVGRLSNFLPSDIWLFSRKADH